MSKSVDFGQMVEVTVRCEQCNKILAVQRMTLGAWCSMCQRHEDAGMDDCNMGTNTRWVDECSKCYEEEFGQKEDEDMQLNW